MKNATLRGHHLKQNLIFDKSNKGNRDNCFDPYIKLKNKFKEHGVDLNTSDLSTKNSVLFEIHQDAQLKTDSVNNYLMMFETDFVAPLNQNAKVLNKYKKIFTWRDDIVDHQRYIKFNFPNPIVIPVISGFKDRPDFCCLIAGNKSVKMPKELNLYLERIKTIRWFELYYPTQFNLFGVDWDLPVVPAGMNGKILKKIFRFLSSYLQMKPFPSYKGRIDHKSQVMSTHRFSICYENVANQNGYITEKIFDSFFSGCVPVYWGARNINNYIPENCFIDRCYFSSHEDLYQYLCSVDEKRFIEYQTNIVSFLTSHEANQFSSEYFADKVVKEILDDLNI